MSADGNGGQKQFGVIPVEKMREMTGLEFLQSVFLQDGPRPPIGQIMNFGQSEIEVGKVMFEGNPSEKFYNPIGTVHGGYALTMLDSCMSCAVQSTLPKGMGYTTVELKVNFVKAMTASTGTIRAEGKVINVGKRIGTAEGRVIDKDGKLIAFGTTTCLIFPI
jgi:uncharacterized protein (TIGR00369 family)